MLYEPQSEIRFEGMCLWNKELNGYYVVCDASNRRSKGHIMVQWYCQLGPHWSYIECSFLCWCGEMLTKIAIMLDTGQSWEQVNSSQQWCSLSPADTAANTNQDNRIKHIILGIRNWADNNLSSLMTDEVINNVHSQLSCWEWNNGKCERVQRG